MKMSGGNVVIVARSGNEYMDPPTAIAVPKSRNVTGVPEIVTASAPGVRVCVPMVRVEPEPRLKAGRP